MPGRGFGVNPSLGRRFNRFMPLDLILVPWGTVFVKRVGTLSERNAPIPVSSSWNEYNRRVIKVVVPNIWSGFMHRISVLMLCLLICGPDLWGQERQPPSPPVKVFTGKTAHEVVRVVDGESVLLDVNGVVTKVRLIGVDAPGVLKSPKKAGPFGEESSRFLRNLLKGESVYIEYEREPGHEDEYERPLAYLFRAPDGLFVNLEVVRQGYARMDAKEAFRYMKLFKDYEKRARKAGKGLWEAEKTEQPIEKTASKEGITVYIQRGGKEYHTLNCSRLKQGKIGRYRIPVDLSEAKRKGLKPCRACRPPK